MELVRYPESEKTRAISRPAAIRMGVAILAVTLVGCGGPKVERQHLRGTVTYKGQPLPTGQIRFSPVKREGLGGALGGAEIKDGQYDTRVKNGLPAPVGEVQVLITAVRRPETDSSTQAPFPGHSTTLVVTSETETFDVEVP